MANEAIRAGIAGVLSEMGLADADIQLERPRDPTHGDLATNVALTLARELKRSPREIADEIAARLDLDRAGVERVEVAGPGFLNFTLSAGAVASVIDHILRENESYGRSDTGDGRDVMVEFVSANPTGPLHLGHGRQAALGDAIASLLEWTGWKVHREFYYNDSGRQMDLLALSVRARYRQTLGRDEPVPDDGYQGEYIKDVADALAEEAGDRYLDDDSQEALDEIRAHAVRMLREEQDRDLDEFRVHFDEHYLESSLYEHGLVEETIRKLGETGLVYEKDGATWLQTSKFGDQKDRVMVRSNGQPTYFLPDVAYHMTKWERGYERVINVQGADHHGTVDRVRAGLQALGLPAGYPEYVLHQMVRVERGGEEVKFSKRAGTGMTLRELYEQVGVDVTRYFFQMRKPDAHLLFDMDVALDRSDKNPVYKIQYAHARMCSIFRKAGLDVELPDLREAEPTGGDMPLDDTTPETASPASGGVAAAAGADLALLRHDLERELIKQLGEFPETVERAARDASPHVVCDYLEQTAGAANSWYHAGNPTRNPELAVLIDDKDLRTARLALARAVQVVLRNGLELLGIDAPLEMIRDDEDTSTEQGE